MRLFVSDKEIEKIKYEARKEERFGIRSDLQWAAQNQDIIARWGPDKGNLPVHNGWHGISVRYACAIVYHRQFNEDGIDHSKKKK